VLKEHGTPVACRVDDEHHTQRASDLDVVDDLVVQHDVIVFGTEPRQA
jgi:hypothetical protein